MQIIYTDSARQNMRAIGRYLKLNDFDVTILDDIYNAIENLLNQFPESGAIYRGNIRKIIVLKKNVVYYEISGDKIYILYVKAGYQSKDI
jgi:plasmid stabilization system protein ParE